MRNYKRKINPSLLLYYVANVQPLRQNKKTVKCEHGLMLGVGGGGKMLLNFCFDVAIIRMTVTSGDKRVDLQFL